MHVQCGKMLFLLQDYVRIVAVLLIVQTQF